MTIGKLVVIMAIVAIVLTGLMTVLKRDAIKNWVVTYLQHFCGALFIFSGWVKAVDPLGTAYKMEQYFDEFYTTFEQTWFGFIAPIFPLFSKYAIWFSVFMIVFEIVLGVMLILGARRKFTSWAFFLLVGFFTILTGFTYLTAYVPSGANFFQFASWSEFNESNMKVTDCGCFGDFIKLKPKVSFFKDIFLLVPALIFLFKFKGMHQLFSKPVRNSTVLFSTIALLFYCFSNYVWDLPHKDFRPFKKGADVRAVRQAEEDAMAAVEITDWKLKHKETGEELVVPNAEYLSNYTAKYKGVYEVLEQISSKPSMEISKISEFEITDLDGNDITDDFIYGEEAQFLIVNYMLKGDPIKATRVVQDSIFNTDTVVVFDYDCLEGNAAFQRVKRRTPQGEAIDMESFSECTDTNVVKSFKEVLDREESYIDQNWSKSYIKKHTDKLKPFTDKAKKAGYRVVMAIGKSDPDAIKDFDAATGLGIEYGMADDILLKTIVRSNPGVVLWKDGKILDKWHIKKLPDFETVEGEYLK